MLTPQQVPYTGPYSLPTGSHRSRGPTALALKRMAKRAGMGFEDKQLAELDEHFNAALEAALDKMAPGMNGYGEKRWEKARGLIVPVGRTAAGQHALDSFARELIQNEAASIPPPVKVPDLGPNFLGGKSVLKQPPTHSTTGIPGYIAYDDAFTQGTAIIACEDMTVDFKLSGASPGEAFYATGASGLCYWYGHLDRNHPLGTRFEKGDFVGKVAPNSIGGGPHVHHAISLKNLVPGRTLKWGADGNGPNYTWGSPTIGEQLEALLAA